MTAPTIEPATARMASSAQRLIAETLQPLEHLARSSANLIANHGVRFEVGGESYELPRYLFVGPRGGNTPIRLGIFAGIYGAEREGVLALVQFMQQLEAKPDLAAGYCLFLYPVCNPSGFEHGLRRSRSGRDLNREFWRESREPEVRLLQSEILSHAFSGIISLYGNGTKNRFYALERGRALTQALVAPAWQAVQRAAAAPNLPVFASSREGLWHAPGILGAPPELRPRPFEIILETAAAPLTWPVTALTSILEEYRKFIAYAPNL